MRRCTAVFGNRRQQRAAAEAPAFANVALVVGSMGVLGAADLDILHSPDSPAGPWKVYLLSHRALPPWSASAEAASSSNPDPVVHLHLDLADPATVAQATDITYVFYAVWSPCPGSTEAQTREANCATLRNLLSAVVPDCPVLHVSLETDRKHFIGPFDPVTGITPAMRPHSDELPRLEYRDLEDALLEFVTGPCPDGAGIIFGFSPRSARNVVASLCVYAAICRKEAVTLRWLGSGIAWEGSSDAYDVELVAEHALWPVLDLESNCKKSTVNCTNGDVFNWTRLWPTLANHFQVDWITKTELDDIAAWRFMDAVINADKEQLDSMNKNKEHGFLGVQNTEEYVVEDKEGDISFTGSYTNGERKAWNLGICCKLLAFLWLISLLPAVVYANTQHDNAVCPVEPIQSYILPRKTCPVVPVLAEHWIHAKRNNKDLTFNSEAKELLKSSFTLNSSISPLLSLKQFGFLLVLGSCITPLLYIRKINKRMTDRIFFFEAKIISIWACSLISSTIYYMSWILFDLFRHYKDTEATESAWDIVYKDLSCCIAYFLQLMILGYRHREAVQGYLRTKPATCMWFTFMICSVCWLSVIFHITFWGLPIFAWISIVPMYFTKWITAKRFKWITFMFKAAGLVGMFIIHEEGKHIMYERAYKIGILCRFIEVMIPGYPFLNFLKLKLKSQLQR